MTDFPSSPVSASATPIALIDRRLEDLAEANAIYGKDQHLNTPYKIARNEREISWLRDLRSELVLSGHAQRPAEPITAEQFARWFYFDCEQPVYVCGDLAEEIMKYFEVRPLPGVELVPPAPADTSTDRPAQPQPSDVVQHVAWLNQYIIGMDENNWKDMRLRAERQLEGLSVTLSISRPDRKCK